MLKENSLSCLYLLRKDLSPCPDYGWTAVCGSVWADIDAGPSCQISEAGPVARCHSALPSLRGELLTITLIFTRILPSWRRSLRKWPGQGGRGSKELRYVTFCSFRVCQVDGQNREPVPWWNSNLLWWENLENYVHAWKLKVFAYIISIWYIYIYIYIYLHYKLYYNHGSGLKPHTQ